MRHNKIEASKQMIITIVNGNVSILKLSKQELEESSLPADEIFQLHDFDL